MTSRETTAAAGLLARTRDGVLLYGLTPPRATTTPEQADAVAGAALARLRSVRVDGLVLYDVDDEADRSSTPRPFPFLPMMDPAVFLDRHLGGWTGPVVVYRAVSKYSGDELGRWLSGTPRDRVLTVLVGAASRDQAVRTSLPDAYRRHAALARPPRMGGVVIAERHAGAGAEHRRMLRKQEAGCEFFVSQVCYDLDRTRTLLSDYAYGCRDGGVDPRPVVLTLAPCGSVTTLEFMSWLGIDVPGWLRTEITRSADPLAVSYEQCVVNARTLVAFCRRLGLPFGINVESLTNRRVEIEASVDLAREVRGLLG
ncbi:5,10-methylenetetrahydrofolate reductase [Pseudonocardia sp. KRD-184]|uniref:5,10-methylenetetrahydrofolate reductase n=1 Tax=Pseudonocardia oceani TaxID=2792013 RepID=A0ABS6UCG0_9PSEU|nr:5,10-methylenetetrahydrofolate reductase [Pseudonocardia oceani]MBW0090852.1 5,10-methylenetetrahydrofolate reductase [Pseudonocardia oceani]MBW0098435.1 5,10-methylenetetrahydrofolate reductase [Pseudonocardia oceani]MBW0110991.1 5,10-methylenetetrahydrofolate reductase [Pseudonocardia oceani]MBW0121758.1 5,10-methylenetetrahydrofolate reductase [Pseudonocardia oceani]MBW0129918.1 5,10-methylenetetrahydrofolate reductase [Pseudonocardia oceani]